MPSPREKLVENLQPLSRKHNLVWDEQLSNDIPRKWRIHGDILLLPSNRCFVDSRWMKYIPSDQFQSTVARSFGSSIKRIAFESPIKNDDFPSPNTRLVLGNDPSMGIGYFTLPFLVHGHPHPRHVYACEWNPDSMEALRRNLQANHIDDDRYTLLLGDNQSTCPIGVADRCNFGLIPSSEASWPVTCRALRSEGGHLHVHDVVNTKEETHNEYSENVRQLIEIIMRNIHHNENSYKCEIEHIERVKPYGPHLDHVVIDLLLTRIA